MQAVEMRRFFVSILEEIARKTNYILDKSDIERFMPLQARYGLDALVMSLYDIHCTGPSCFPAVEVVERHILTNYKAKKE